MLKIGHYAYEFSAPNAVSCTAGNSNRQAIKKVPKRGPTLLRKRNVVTDSQKEIGSVGAGYPTDPATSSEFAGLLMKVAPNTQSLCVATSGKEVFLITLKLEGADNLPLRALVYCGASNNFVQRQLLDNSKLKYIE